jgi:hypothetical protein
MRTMLKVSDPVDTGSAAVRDGSLVQWIQSVLVEMKPEAVYVTDVGGKRTGLIFLDMTDTSQIPAVADPWFLAFNTSIEIKAVINPDDLAKAQAGITTAAKKYG